MGSDWRFGQWQKVADDLKDAYASIFLDTPKVLIQDFCLYLTFSVTTVNVALSTDKYVLTYLFGIF